MLGHLWRWMPRVLWMLPLLLLAACSSGQSAAGRMPTATAGEIRLQTDRTSYSTHTPIGVTITNAGAKDYYARDGRSGCTIIQLQRYDDAKGQWNSVFGCPPGPSPRIVIVPKGIGERFTLAPGSSADPNAWQPGTYRIAAAYSANADAATGEQVVYSAGFTIGS
jgi:hypothetical protein